VRRCPWYGLECCNCDTFPFTKDGSAPEVCRALRAGEPAIQSKGRTKKTPNMELYVGKPCAYCHVPMTRKRGPAEVTRDHVVPRSSYRSLGRPAPPSNIVIVCARCNGDKRALLIETWLRRLREANDPRAPLVEAFVRSRSPPAPPAEPTCVTDCESSKDWKAPRWA
jgi:hypothetical protein